jgi:hypothetical protein
MKVAATITASVVAMLSVVDDVKAARARDYVTDGLYCIHRYEGSWDANTGNGYYGGLQMDLPFQRAYGWKYLQRWGTADNWPSWAQIDAARRAYYSGRRWTPWPNTARMCGLA